MFYSVVYKLSFRWELKIPRRFSKQVGENLGNLANASTLKTWAKAKVEEDFRVLFLQKTHKNAMHLRARDLKSAKHTHG